MHLSCEWNSNLIASVFHNCTWIRLSKVNFRIFPKWCMCCDVAGTTSNRSATSWMFFLCGNYIPVQKLAVLSQHVHTAFTKHNLEKGETALMEGLRALTHSGLFCEPTFPLLWNWRKHLQAHSQPLYIWCWKCTSLSHILLHVAKAISI